MPITTLDPRTALIVIDLQKGILGLPSIHPIAGVIERASALAATFRRHAVPVVLVTVTGVPPGRTEQPRRTPRYADGWADLVPELNRQPGDHTVVKRAWGAFTNTGLDEHLKELGVTQVVITGVSTSAGVESTARSAHECGFHVTLATDAMTDLSFEAHNHGVTRIFPRLGETGTVEEIIAMLRSTRPRIDG